jgi:hypothetical protein
MAWSRTYLQVHWLTNVTAGALLGSGVSLLAFAIAQRHERTETRSTLHDAIRSQREPDLPMGRPEATLDVTSGLLGDADALSLSTTATGILGLGIGRPTPTQGTPMTPATADDSDPRSWLSVWVPRIGFACKSAYPPPRIGALYGLAFAPHWCRCPGHVDLRRRQHPPVREPDVSAASLACSRLHLRERDEPAGWTPPDSQAKSEFRHPHPSQG